ncbi:GNAT family N-acetyltransferase [Candidatus Peregrinibacteria bacterium]|nr:GNAT family N-acetyltransferase [Candidatus Peregrinibacteria bacterium]
MSSDSNVSTINQPPISISIAEEKDLENLIIYLSQKEVDNAFVKPLSERPISIRDRVFRDFKEGFWLIGKDEEENVIASLAIIYHDYTAECSTFSISPLLRGRHIGTKILIEAEMILQSMFPEIHMIVIDSWEGNTPVKKLVEKLDYKEINRYVDTRKRPQGVKTITYGKDIK